jgi:hypothetical protein
MRWAEHVTRVRKKRNLYMVVVGRPERKVKLGIPNINWSEILKWILKK